MDKKAVLIVVFAGLTVWLLGAMLLIQASALVWFGSELGQTASVADLIESYIDQQVDSGATDIPVNFADPLLERRKILLAHGLNAHTAKHVTTKLMYLNEVDSSEPIDLYISTQGGYVDSAFTIIDTMRLIDAPVNTWAIGGCYSAGAMILTAATGTRYASPNAMIMVHANFAESEEPYSYERLATARYEQLWRETANLPEEWFPMTDDESYYVTPEQALEMGLIDEIVP